MKKLKVRIDMMLPLTDDPFKMGGEIDAARAKIDELLGFAHEYGGASSVQATVLTSRKKKSESSDAQLDAFPEREAKPDDLSIPPFLRK